MTGRSSLPVLLALVLSSSLAAQDPPRAPGAPDPVKSQVFDAGATTIPYFPLEPGPYVETGPARPGAFVSSVGRKAIAMGTEDGALELWSWPVKWLHDFELSFRIPKYTAPIPGRSVARDVSVSATSVTITYAHEQFTVRETIFTPLDEPAVMILLEVDAIRPIEILAEFTPDIHYAWPAGLGGQYLVWEQNARAFLFSDGRRQVNAFMGSPAVTQASDVPAHMLSAERPRLVLGVGGTGDRYTAPRLGEPPGKNVNIHAAYIPIVLAGGVMSRDEALALYTRLSQPGAAAAEWQKRQAHARQVVDGTMRIATPDGQLDQAFDAAKINLDESMVCNPDLGCGLVAGYGLSGGASDRPGFGWFFGGDAAINSFAMSGVGQTDLVRDGVLTFFAKYQRADGKITHEISQGAGHVNWFDYPYPYYHGDTTPFWILAAGEYWRATGDTATIRALWPNLTKAFAWSRATDTDGDGLMENPAAGAGALEVGDLQIGILSDVYLAGVWVSALDRFARMADAVGEAGAASEARALGVKARATMEAKLWLPGERQYAFALLKDGSVNPNLTAWPATAMAFDVFDPAHGAAMAERLASSAIMTDWGARPLSSSSALFDPLHYNNGAVWPFVTGFVSLAQYRYHNPAAGLFALRAIAATARPFARTRNPEVLSGRLYMPLDTAVPQQFFATSMVITPMVRGLLGLDVDVPARRLTLAPHLPPGWATVRVSNVPLGGATATITLTQAAGRVSAVVERASGDTSFEVVFSPALPIGATARGTGVTMAVTPGDVHATVTGRLERRLELAVSHAGGWWLEMPAPDTPVGGRSRTPRLVSERLVSGAYEATLQGLAGTRATFPLHQADGAVRAITVAFPATGADADGFTVAVFRAGSLAK